MRVRFLILAAGLAGCAQFVPGPDLDARSAAQDAPFPELVPLAGLLNSARQGSTIIPETRSFEQRVAALNARAAALRGRSIVDGATRLRLLSAADRNVQRIAR